MRELWSTGWLHNRMRMVCASFLVKNLLLPWQWGLKHYWDAQLDADLECDALGWQYCSGCLAGMPCLEEYKRQYINCIEYQYHIGPNGSFAINLNR